MSIIKDALNTLKTLEEPGQIIDLPYDWGKEFTYRDSDMRTQLPPDQQPPQKGLLGRLEGSKAKKKKGKEG